MAFRRRVTLMRTRAETLRRGSVRGSGRAPIRFTPAVPQALGPYLDRGQSKLVADDFRCVLNDFEAVARWTYSRQLCASVL
jgi:hypothetical protein